MDPGPVVPLEPEEIAAQRTPSRAVRRVAARGLRVAVGAAFVVLWFWTLGALYFLAGGLGWLLAAAFFAVSVGARFRSPRVAWGVLGIGLAVGGLWFATAEPRHDREWQLGAERVPSAAFDGDLVTIRDLRAFRYRGPDEVDAVYREETFDLGELESADFLISYWDGNTAIAHSMLSFGFADGRYLCLSVEMRREVGEEGGALAGLYKQLEVILVLGDERDLVNLRTSVRGEDVYLYRLAIPLEDVRTYLEHVLRDCNRVVEEPRWYGTLQFNCHSSLTRLAARLWPDSDRVTGWRALLNGYADREMYARGRLVTGGLDFDALRRRSRITDRGREARDDPEFSRRIRSHLPQ